MTREVEFMRYAGNALNVQRVSLGMTQEQLAVAVNVDRSVVSRWENGDRMMTLFEWTQIESVFDAARRAVAKEVATAVGAR